MMKKLFLIIAHVFFISSFSQMHEIGFIAGGSNFIGDIGNENYWYPNDIGGGLIYKFNLNSRIAIRGNYTHIKIKDNDKNASNLIRKARGLSFNNTIKEFALGLEFNFFRYNLASRNTAYTPYILIQFAAFNYSSPLSINNYSTTLSKKINDNISVKNVLSYTVPVGVGFKGELGDNFAFAIEAAVRFTLKDDLDYSTSKISSLNYTGNGNDTYVFTGFSIVYTFGRPSCYAFSVN